MDELLTSLNLDSVRGFSEKEIDQGEIPTQTAKDKVPVHLYVVDPYVRHN